MKAVIFAADSGRSDAVQAGIAKQWPGSVVEQFDATARPSPSALAQAELVVVDCAAHGANPAALVATVIELSEAPVVATGATSDLEPIACALDAGASAYIVVGDSDCMVDAVLRKLVKPVRAGQEVASLGRQIESLQRHLADRDRMLRNADREKRELAQTDPLTQLSTRPHFVQRLRIECDRAKRYHAPIACLMIDIDHFRHMNNTHGVDAGNDALKRIAEILLDHARGSDVVCRYGGEEFAVLLPHTDVTGALSAAERVRAAVADEDFGLTVSVGLCTFPEADAQSDSQLLDGAERALKHAKADGRNRVCVYGKDPRFDE